MLRSPSYFRTWFPEGSDMLARKQASFRAQAQGLLVTGKPAHWCPMHLLIEMTLEFSTKWLLSEACLPSLRECIHVPALFRVTWWHLIVVPGRHSYEFIRWHHQWGGRP